MQPIVQSNFPEMPETHLRLELSLVTSQEGEVVVGWSVEGLVSELPLAIGCLPPCTRQDLASKASEVLDALMGAAATLHDWPPFED